MASDLDELVKLLDQWSIQTSGGSFVKTDSVKHWVEEQRRRTIEGAMTAPRPRDFNQAKRMAARDPEVFPQSTGPQIRDPGSSITAGPPAATNVTGT